MANKEAKVSLVLVKKLIGELEVVLDKANGLSETKETSDVNEYIVELAKASGVAAAVAQEATLLVGDIKHLIKVHSTPSASAKDDELAALLGLVKGSNSGLPGAN